MAEDNYEKAYGDKYKQDGYYLYKLKFAVGNRNIKEADLYFSKIKLNTDFSNKRKIISDYFLLKKDLYTGFYNKLAVSLDENIVKYQQFRNKLKGKAPLQLPL